MKKSFFMATALLCLSLGASAVPAKRVTRTATLADGTKVEVTLRGDEFGHYFEASDGTMYRKLENGIFEKVDDADQMKSAIGARRAQANERRRARFVQQKASFEGTKRGLVILVNFSDKKMTYSQAEFQAYFNEIGYSKYGMGGSVRDYFLSQSYGKLDIEFDVIGPVTVSNGYAYYGGNDYSGNDKHPAAMVIEALKLVNDSVDFSKYDWDDDKEVDQVYVIYAGYGEASGTDSNPLEDTIWPHEYSLSSAKYYGDGTGALKYDGVRIDTYACSNELMGVSGTSIDGVGTACHEFSHCLGFPDFYDTSGSSTLNFGMDVWDIMDSGCYNGDGKWPCGYTSYERMIAGWLTPTELTEYTEVTNMQALTDAPEAYIIYNKANRNEYYLLENHQLKSWDKKAYGHGMLILHVDYNQNIWQNNTVNNTKARQRMTIIPADNSYSNRTAAALAGDPWPGTKKKTSLTNTTTPAAKLYNNNSTGDKFLNYPLNNITEKSGLISFVGGTKPDAILSPFALDEKPSEVYDLNGRKVTWPKTNGIYIINGRKVLK